MDDDVDRLTKRIARMIDNPRHHAMPGLVGAQVAYRWRPQAPLFRNIPEAKRLEVAVRMWKIDVPAYEIARHIGVPPQDLTKMMRLARAEDRSIEDRRAGWKPHPLWEARLDELKAEVLK